MRALSLAGRGLARIARFIVAPFSWMFTWSFRLLMLPAYSGYKRLRRNIAYHPRFIGVRTFGHFFQRYSLYLAMVAIGVFGVTHNLVARTVRPDEIGQDALWTDFTPEEEEEVIVEVGVPQASKSASVIAVGGPELTNTDTTAAVPTVSTVESLAAVGSLDQTVADTPRETVESYIVQGGDTISTIGQQFGVSSRTILWANGLGESDFIKPGQSLKIPAQSGYLYTVKSGDTLNSIAQKYKGQSEEILAANNIALAEAIQPGQEIIIPGGEPPAPPPSTVQPSRTLLGIIVGNPPPSAPRTSARFSWPTTGRRVNQYFRGRRHTGVDIDGEYSSAVYAASAGRVTYASSDRSGYGLHITIDHGNGFSTLYAHASKVFVRAGQSVTQGQTIAMQGCTGRCSGVHLHFEIRSSGSPVNPLAYY